METVNTTQQTNKERIDEVGGPIIIRMWPKTPVMYPMAILALICSFFGSIFGSSPHINRINAYYNPTAQEIVIPEESTEIETTEEDITVNETTTEVQTAQLSQADVEQLTRQMANRIWVDRFLGILFLIVFGFSMLTLCVDLEIRWALITFTVTLVIILALILLNQRYEFMPAIFHGLLSISPMANPQFYLSIFIIWVALMIVSLGVVRFHYVKIESNEVIVVGGLLERQQRFPTMRMNYIKDIQDVLEYYLPFVNSGRLVLTFQEHQESVVIDTVINIEKVIDKLDKISGVLQVSNRQ